jgi:hypothetical protein
MTAIR